MIWTTDLIEEYIKDPVKVKRDFNIHSILNGAIDFKDPFYGGEKKFLHGLKFRSDGILFEYTKDETENVLKTKDINFFIDFLEIGKNDYQNDMFEKLSNNRMNLFHVSRQIGTSVNILTYSLHFCMMNFYKSVVIFSNFKGNEYHIMLSLIESLPFYMKPGIRHNEKDNFIMFGNGSSIRFIDYSEILGYSPDFLVLSDFAYAKNSSIIYKSVIHCVVARSNDRLIIYSTSSENENNLFNELVKNSRNNNTPFNLSVYEHDSNVDPEYIIRTNGIESYFLEYCCLLPTDVQYKREILLNRLNLQ